MIQQSMQFGGLAHEDPNLHIANFLDICDTFKHNGVSDEAIRLRLFPFSLRDKAKSWLTSLPTDSITTWEQMTQKFMSRYFPPAKTAQLRNDITMFMQVDTESLYEAWERFKDMLRRCPHHELPVWLQVQTFYNGLNSEVRNMINDVASGTLGKKTPEQAYELLEERASNSYQWPIKRLPVRRTSGVHNINVITALAAQMQALNKKIDGLQMQKPVIVASMCDFCGQDHPNHECQSGNMFAVNSMPNQANYVSNFRKPNNNPYNETYNLGWRNHPNFYWSNNNQVKPPLPGFQSQEKKSNLKEMMAKQQGHLSSDIEKNPNEQCKAITLRDGKVVSEEESQKKVESEAELPVSIEEKKANSENKTETKVKEIAKGKGKALAQMSSYAKFLKDIFSNKRKIEEHGTIMLTEECSVVLQNKLPPKLRDPESFTIPCALGDSFFDKALCDLSASINLMPLSIFKKLELGEVKEMTMSLQLADRSIKRPKGIVEDILLKVDKFIFLVDFVVLDMEEDQEVPLILGHPFLATARALIDVQQGKLILRLNDEEIVFDVHKAMKNPTTFYIESCFHSDSFGEIVGDHREEVSQKDSLERCLMESSTTEDEDPCFREEAEALENESLTDNNMELKEDLHKTPNETPKLELKPFLHIKMLTP
ncbi:uncharacterized protein LOC116118985 [Pistacia vera]|uniref:uncharacterized protein LOC116118985 n=1 Tax=Pistacia vera TaxID=55513 RepID=UPI001262EABD|nr:uncharacterized protein LOC116118985 [Pistacia vera]